MAEIALAGGSHDYLDDPTISQTSINVYPERIEARGKANIILVSSEGIALERDGLDGSCRALLTVGGVTYGVFGETLYRYTEGSAPVAIGTIPGTERLAFDYNEQWIMFVNDSFNGYTWDIDNSDFAQIPTTEFVLAKDVVYLSGYFVVAEAGNSRRFFVSGVNDPRSWDALDFATKEQDSEAIRGLIVNNGDLVLLGNTGTEYWRVGANTDFPFELQNGAESERGMAARDSAEEIDNSFAFLGDDLVVYLVQGYTPVRISHHGLERYLDDLSEEEIRNAYAISYTREGHYFYALTAGSATWVYDATASALVGQRLWHHRQSTIDAPFAQTQPWRANFVTENFGRFLVGDSIDSVMGALSTTERTEYGELMWAARITANIQSDVDFTTHNRLELKYREGVGTSTEEALITMENSRDGGRTWSSPKPRSMGFRGDRRTRIIWRRLGRAVDRVYRFTTATRRHFVWQSLHLDGEVNA